MKKNLIVGIVILMMSCQENAKQQLEKDAKLMATLECEARQLKEYRFKVANDIRFMEDSLMKTAKALTATQSKEIDSIRNELTLRTGGLADKITKTMDSLFTLQYKTTEQRHEFDVATEKILQEVCK